MLMKNSTFGTFFAKLVLFCGKNLQLDVIENVFFLWDNQL